MRPFVAFLSACFAVLASAAPTSGPVRVLYLDASGEEQSAVGPLHSLMAELGRDAIWFDYATGATPDAATLARYDVLAVKPKANGSPVLAGVIKLPSGATLPVLVVKADETVADFPAIDIPAIDIHLAFYDRFQVRSIHQHHRCFPGSAEVASYEKRLVLGQNIHVFTHRRHAERGNDFRRFRLARIDDLQSAQLIEKINLFAEHPPYIGLLNRIISRRIFGKTTGVF